MASGVKGIWSWLKTKDVKLEFKQEDYQRDKDELIKLVEINNQRGVIRIETTLMTKCEANYIATNIEHEKARQTGRLNGPVSIKCDKAYSGGMCVICGSFGEYLWWEGPAKSKPKSREELKNGKPQTMPNIPRDQYYKNPGGIKAALCVLCQECRISFPKIEVIMTQRLGARQAVCDCLWTGNKWIKCQICLDDITNRRLLVYGRHRIWSWNKTFCDLTSKGKIEGSGLSIDNTNYQQQLGNSGVDYLWSYRIKKNMDDIQSKWLLVDPRTLGPELGSLKTCFDDKGRTFQPDNGTGIIWSLGTIAKTLLESNIGEHIMAPRIDFPRRGECDDTNSYMRCQFGQLDEERCPNKIILKRSKVLCVPIAFWRQNNQQAAALSPGKKPIMEGETADLPAYRLTLMFKVILNMTTTSEPQILACAFDLDLAQD